MSEHIIVERDRRVLVVRLNRPQALNALNTDLARDLVGVLEEADRDPAIGAFVITGSERAFAAGADIREMASRTSPPSSAMTSSPSGTALPPSGHPSSPPSPAMPWAADANLR